MYRLLTIAGILAALPATSPIIAAQTEAPLPATVARHRAAADALPADDGQDAAFAARGFVTTRRDPVIRAADGSVAWRLDAYDAVRGKSPDSVHPSLWRHAGLLAKHGLFRVTDDIWQVRGFDLANITFVRGRTGWIVIDALSCAETARAAYDLVSENLGKRPIAAIIVTHSHSDHFGGVAGLATPAQIAAGTVPLIAPKGFFEEAVSENVIAGPAMARRATYQFGLPLAPGATGSMGSGIGTGLSRGTPSLLRPTREIDVDGQEATIDGVRLRFLLTPGTEAPAEMNVVFPDWNVIDMAENANVTQHNILTPRGARIRDTRAWANGLTRAIDGNPDAQVMIGSHGWPRFGKTAVRDYLVKHRDAYAYLHDQTVRMMNQGLTGDEIATRIQLPPSLAREWYNRPYYGSLAFNARAVYQFYLGWYDANPVHLAPMAPSDAGKRYVAALGGAARVIELATAAYDKGDYAWAAELLNRLVMADGQAMIARDLLARCYEQLAWQSENSLWRNIYLTGARELRAAGPAPATLAAGRGAFAGNLATDDLFAVLATRLDPARAGDARLVLVFDLTDTKERVVVTVEHGVLIPSRAVPATGVDATLSIRRADLVAALLGGAPLATRIAAGEAKIAGDPASFVRLVRMLDAPTPNFPIVLPPAAAR